MHPLKNFFKALRNICVVAARVVIAFGLCSCEGPSASQDQNAESVTKAYTNAADSIAPAVREYPLLTDTNSKEFLLRYFEENKERKIALSTRLGTLKINLFEDTPLHSANFLMLVKRGYFNNTEFTRIIEGFVVQGGNNENEMEEVKRMLIGTYHIESEMQAGHIHRRGALAAARHYENNPEKKSSPYNFYLVHGQIYGEPGFMALEREQSMRIPASNRAVYSSVGGAPHLDGAHTVFGEIYEGMEVLDRMAAVKTDESDWPLEPLIMEMTVSND